MHYNKDRGTGRRVMILTLVSQSDPTAQISLLAAIGAGEIAEGTQA